MYATYLRNEGHDVYWDWSDNPFFDLVITSEKQIPVPFLKLPRPDREFTRAKDPKWQKNGNFKYLPATYMQVANGCWHGRCGFCVEKDKPYEVRPVEDVIAEIEECKRLGFREVFDDSGTFPTGEWLTEFCRRMEGMDTVWGCNMRIIDIDYRMLKKSNCRMVLFGLESNNQRTLDKINKGVKVEDIIPTIKRASDCGLDPHIACMFGYPWESDKDAERTLRMVHYLLRKGYAKTAQASFYTVPNEKTKETHKRYIKDLWSVWKYPDFWFNQLKDLRNKDDLK
jgi:radical SAM superfamily enzyme YgiQ (UPF0313 family)